MFFLIATVLLFNLIAIFIPKRLTKIEMYASSFFALYFALLTDVYLAVKHDLYGYFDKGVDYDAIIPMFGLYPSANIIILNYFPFGKGIKSKMIYILGWSAFLVIFEWLSVKSGYFYHNGWKYWHSALAYPIILAVLAWNLTLIRKLIKQLK